MHTRHANHTVTAGTADHGGIQENRNRPFSYRTRAGSFFRAITRLKTFRRLGHTKNHCTKVTLVPAFTQREKAPLQGTHATGKHPRLEKAPAPEMAPTPREGTHATRRHPRHTDDESTPQDSTDTLAPRKLPLRPSQIPKHCSFTKLPTWPETYPFGLSVSEQDGQLWAGPPYLSLLAASGEDFVF